MTDRDYARTLAAYRTAILTTRGADGHFHARPMAMRQQVRGEEIWFATSIDSKKCRDLEAEPHCALTFTGEADGTTTSISGIGEVIRDRKLVRELWDASWSRWFPAGPEAPELALIRVIPEHVERHGPGPGALEVLFTAPRRSR
ncbi:MAG TPA: pyridoxamine 5'-phosphate oxidase family protein [Anaeromyxobacteraceae bacterium]|nr:pyridoxamine 5'-phosphate oxidase family protein [Anaeromyxobacteraceae bacterium]